MSETIEVEAKTVQEAIEEAARRLGVSPEDLEIEVLDTGSGKVLGVLGKQRNARISATVKKDREKAEEKEKEAQQEPETVSIEEKWKDGVQPEFEMPKKSYAIEADEEEIPAGVEEARKVLQDICRFIDPDVEVQVIPAQEHFRLYIPAGGSGIFIGKSGQTLEAIQYVINRIMSQRGYSDLKLVVDSEDYRIRKDNQLREHVKKLAEKARRTGKPQFTEPLNSFDRRIVHLALKDEPGVETYSVGTGDKRRVQIRPTQKRKRAGSRESGGTAGSGESKSSGAREG